MAESSPTDVAREINDWFQALPYSEFHEAMLAHDNFDDAEAEFIRRGWAPIRHLLDADIQVGDDGFTGAAPLPSGRGLDVFFRYWKTWVEPWQNIEWTTTGEYEEIGDWVTVVFGLRIQGEMSGAEVEVDVCQLYRVEGGQITHYETKQNRDQALQVIEAAARG